MTWHMVFQVTAKEDEWTFTTNEEKKSQEFFKDRCKDTRDVY